MNFTKNEPVLTIDNVSLSIGDNKILSGVNAQVLDIHRTGHTQGQIIGLLGPSGVGKTKMFEIMSGIITKDTEGMNLTGSVLVGQEQKPVEIGKVGVVQQSYPLFNHMTVERNLMVDAVDRSKVDEALDLLGMKQHAKKYPMQLSGGQRQRVAIAQQLVRDNGILLMDEPFSGLDALMISKVSEMIVRVANYKDTNTVIIISHDVTSTASISDTLWVMGRDFDGNNQPIPGSRIKHIYDLATAGMAWREDILKDTAFLQMCSEIKGLYPTL